MLCLKEVGGVSPRERTGAVSSKARGQCPPPPAAQESLCAPTHPPRHSKGPKTHSNRSHPPSQPNPVHIDKKHGREPRAPFQGMFNRFFLFNTDVPHTPSGVRVPLQSLWVPKALRRELSGRNPAGMIPHRTSSESCTSSLGIWQLCHHQLTLLTPTGGSLGVATAFQDGYSNFSNALWETNGLAFLSQLTPSKGPRALPWEAVPAAGLKAQRIVRYSSLTLQHSAVKKVP